MPHPLHDELAHFVRGTRRSNGLTQEQLALLAGVGRRFVSELERGKESVRLGHVLAIVETLGGGLTLGAGRDGDEAPGDDRR